MVRYIGKLTGAPWYLCTDNQLMGIHDTNHIWYITFSFLHVGLISIVVTCLSKVL